MEPAAPAPRRSGRPSRFTVLPVAVEVTGEGQLRQILQSWARKTKHARTTGCAVPPTQNTRVT